MRITVAATLLWLHPQIRWLRVGLVPDELWRPVGIAWALGAGPPNLTAVVWATSVSWALVLCVLVGFATRAALFALWPLLLLEETWLNCAGKVTHGTTSLLWGVLFLALSPCGRALSLDALLAGRRARPRRSMECAPRRTSPYARWPVDLLFLEISSFYARAGIAKLRESGFAWADGSTLQHALLNAESPRSLWLAGHPALCAVLSCLVLLFELSAPLGMIRRLRPVVLVGGLAFHAGTTAFLSISFSGLWPLYAAFLPWSRLLRRGRRAIRAIRGNASGGRAAS